MPTPTFNPGEALAAGKLQTLAQYGTYTPLLLAHTTNPNLGTGPSQVGYYWVTGQLVNVWAFITFGTSPSAGSGRYDMSLPTQFPLMAAFNDWSVGTCRLLDSSASSEAVGFTMVDMAQSTVTVWFEIQGSGPVTNAAPFTWAAGDVLFMHATYLTNPY